jgi:hypothetical protein
MPLSLSHTKRQRERKREHKTKQDNTESRIDFRQFGFRQFEKAPTQLSKILHYRVCLLCAVLSQLYRDGDRDRDREHKRKQKQHIILSYRETERQRDREQDRTKNKFRQLKKINLGQLEGHNRIKTLILDNLVLDNLVFGFRQFGFRYS